MGPLAQTLIGQLPLKSALQDRSFLVTGTTGMIGGALVSFLRELTCLLPGLNLRITAQGRSEEKLSRLFSHSPDLDLLVCDVADLGACDKRFDFLVHCAAPTDSRFYVEHPVETIQAIVSGTQAILELARTGQARSVVVLSSMEVYGSPLTEEPLTEEMQGYIDPLALRSSYPQAKRLAETLCAAYAGRYAVPVKIVRLGQVIGHELQADDKRLIAQMIHAVQSGDDIKLASDGMSKQTYLGIDDALSALLFVLLKGENGKAYNAANEETYCSIRELAELVATLAPEKGIKVQVAQQPDASQYPPTRALRLASDALRALGWEPTQSLRPLLTALIAD